MAEPLPVLIKLAESKVEGVQRDIAQVLDLVGKIDEKVARLLAEMMQGGEVAQRENFVTLYQQAGAFAGRVKTEVANLKAQKAKLEGEVERLRKVLAGHFAEQKRYEVLWARKQAEAKRRREAKQQEALDEVAGVQEWLRRKEQA